MIKKQSNGKDRKEQLKSALKDRLYHFLLEDGGVRGAVCRATAMAGEMRANHDLGVLETLVLGHAYMGAALMASNLKSRHDRLSLQIECSGPIRGLTAEANPVGDVRGYLRQVPIPVEKELSDFNLSPFFGAGFLKVTRHLENAKHPFTGQVMLDHGNIAQDLANYYLVSEQIPTAFNLSIQFDGRGEVTGAGGLLLQIMPGAGKKLGKHLERRIDGLPSLGQYFSEDGDTEALLLDAFQGFNPKLLGHKRLEFYCPCNRDQLRGILMLLPEADFQDIKENGPFPVELRCHNCNTVYGFNAEEIEEIYGLRRSNN